MRNEKGRFDGKVSVVTGASTGIGRATAVAFAREGATVAIGDMNEDESRETVRLIKGAGGKALLKRTNVAVAADVKALVDSVVDQLGRIDVAFNNAGVLPPTKPLIDMEESDWDKTINVDLKGVWLSMKYEIAQMLKNGGGAIVNTASVAGLIADPQMAPYVAAKHGVVGLTRAAAIEYSSQGIRVNAIAPGGVKTSLSQ